MWIYSHIIDISYLVKSFYFSKFNLDTGKRRGSLGGMSETDTKVCNVCRQYLSSDESRSPCETLNAKLGTFSCLPQA